MRLVGARTGIAIALVLTSLLASLRAHATGAIVTMGPGTLVVRQHRTALRQGVGGPAVLWDQIEFAGSAQFAWVLPVPPDATVETHVASGGGELLDLLDQMTALNIFPPAQQQCVQPAGLDAGFPGFDAANPYRTVVLNTVLAPYRVDTLTGADAANVVDRLTALGYRITPGAAATMRAYAAEGNAFVVARYLPAAGLSFTGPIRVTYPTPTVALPLRMAAIGAEPTLVLRLFVVGNALFRAANYANAAVATIEPTLVWDWTTSSSDYEPRLHALLASTGGGLSVVTESSGAFEQLGGTSVDGDVEYTVAQQIGVLITRIRTELAVGSVTTDLSLQEAGSGPVPRDVFLTHEVGAPLLARCPAQAQIGTGGGTAFTCSSAPRRNDPRYGLPSLGLLAIAGAGFTVVRRRRARAMRSRRFDA